MVATAYFINHRFITQYGCLHRKHLSNNIKDQLVAGLIEILKNSYYGWKTKKKKQICLIQPLIFRLVQNTVPDLKRF